MSNTVLGIIIGVLGTGILAVLFRNKIPGTKNIKKIFGNGPGRTVTGATAEVIEKDAPENSKDKDSSSVKEVKRRMKIIDKILRRSGIIIFILLMFTKIDAKSDNEEIRKFTEDSLEYVKITEAELDNLRNNSRKDTTVTVLNIDREGSIFVKIRIPTRQPVFTEDGSKLIDSSPIVRTVKVNPKTSNYSIIPGFGYNPDVIIGGSYSFKGNLIDNTNFLIGMETLTYNSEYIRLSLCPFVGLRRFGLSISMGSNNNFSGLRTLIGVGRSYSKKNELSFEIGVAASIGI